MGGSDWLIFSAFSALANNMPSLSAACTEYSVYCIILVSNTEAEFDVFASLHGRCLIYLSAKGQDEPVDVSGSPLWIRLVLSGEMWKQASTSICQEIQQQSERPERSKTPSYNG